MDMQAATLRRGFRRWLPVLVSAASAASFHQSLASEPCAFHLAFDRVTKNGIVHIYEGSADPKINGARPLAFVASRMDVNTDGTRVSYNVDDPLARHGAINNIGNALRHPRDIASFRKIAASGFEPVARTWKVLDPSIIEADSRTHKPCVDADGYLVSMSAVPTFADAGKLEGNCDQSKWLDPLSVPALVLPKPRIKEHKSIPTEFDLRAATTRSAVVAMRLDGSRPLSFGIVGDRGPVRGLGEASIAMNVDLNMMPSGSVPKSAHDADVRFVVQGPSIVLIFPGEENRAPYPLTGEAVRSGSSDRFKKWGGVERLLACLAEIPEARRNRAPTRASSGSITDVPPRLPRAPFHGGVAPVMRRPPT